MAYVSLYRRYRPQSFDDVVGQHHVTRTLVHAIEEGRIHHAYLFTGPRGTGKTSTARILAKALNCESGPTPTPCNDCEQCRAITSGTSVDVIELDMASHGGVDDARELRERALFAPASARRKVYILDEVHMASTAAFNALLKLIEEPPAHVLFAMATTDPQKVLPTILSRVQRLDLRRVAASDVADHVRRICQAEGYTIDDGAIEAVVRAGDGSVRDTLSVLEQVLAFAGTEVDTDAVAQVLGQTPAERVFETVDLVADRDVAGLLALVQGLLDQGHDLRRFTLDLVQHLRDLLVLQVAPDRPDLVDATDERRDRLGGQAGVLPRETLLRAVELLADTVAEQRQGSPRLPLELVLAKLATPGADGDLAELADRVGRIEQGAPVAPAPARATPAPATAPSVSSPEVAVVESSGDDPSQEADVVEVAVAEPVEAAPAPSLAPVDDPAVDGPEDELTLLQSRWDGVLDLLKDQSRRCHAVFLPAEPMTLSRGILTLRYPRRYASFHAQNATKAEYADPLRQAVERSTGLRVRVDVKIEGEDMRRPPVPPSVTPDDARTPVLDELTPAAEEVAPVQEPPAPSAGEDPAGTDDEASAVREAELDPTAPADVPHDLLELELGAELIDERPAPGTDR